mgnify:CR=1 FL=1
MVDIVPAILTNSQADFSQKLAIIHTHGKRVHVDCIDTTWCPNQTLGPQLWGAIPGCLMIEAHLMVGNPLDWIKPCVESGCTTIISQIETIRDQVEFMTLIKKRGLKVGFAVDIDTPLTMIEQDVYEKLDSVLLLSVKAGYSGQEFNCDVVQKIRNAKQLFPKSIVLGVDGGIDLVAAKLCIRAGADELVVNSYLWPDFENNLRLLQQIQ